MTKSSYTDKILADEKRLGLFDNFDVPWQVGPPWTICSLLFEFEFQNDNQLSSSFALWRRRRKKLISYRRSEKRWTTSTQLSTKSPYSGYLHGSPKRLLAVYDLLPSLPYWELKSTTLSTNWFTSDVFILILSIDRYTYWIRNKVSSQKISVYDGVLPVALGVWKYGNYVRKRRASCDFCCCLPFDKQMSTNNQFKCCQKNEVHFYIRKRKKTSLRKTYISELCVL